MDSRPEVVWNRYLQEVNLKQFPMQKKYIFLMTLKLWILAFFDEKT